MSLGYGYYKYLAGGKKGPSLSTIFTAIAVVAVVALVIVAPPASIALVPGVTGGVGLSVSVALASTTTAVLAGVAVVSGVAAVIAYTKEEANKNIQNDDLTQNGGLTQDDLITGKPGIAEGTILIDKTNSGLAYHLELAPADETAKTWVEANKQTTYAGTSGWRLPSIDELARIRLLWFEHALFTSDKISKEKPEVYLWTSSGYLPPTLKLSLSQVMSRAPVVPGSIVVKPAEENYDYALWLPTGELAQSHAGGSIFRYALVREYNP